jgi:uncharacterized alpha-E superfamily protein
MLSRVADSLYWMSRYLERAENTTRVLNTHINLMLERGTASEESDWARILRSLGIDTTPEDAGHAEQLAHSLLFDPANHASIVASVNSARENARAVRELITSTMWEQLNRLFHGVRRTGVQDIWAAQDFLQAVRDGANLFHGFTDSNMTHGEGWQFIQAGRYLERAVNVSTIVGVHFREYYQPNKPDSEREDYLEWIGLLRSCTAFEAYCKVYTADLQSARIAEFLVLHPTFPHSIRFCADSLETAIREIGREADSRRASRVERMAGRLRATLGFGQIDEVMSGGLHTFLEGVLRQCGQVHAALFQTYISYPIEAALQA